MMNGITKYLLTNIGKSENVHDLFQSNTLSLNFNMLLKRGRTFRKRRRKSKEINFSSETQDNSTGNINLLLKWMGNQGFKPSKKLQIKHFIGCGRGLMAKETIEAGSVFVSVPLNLLITPKSVLDSNLGTSLKRYCPQASGQEILSVFLMVENIKGKTSKWYPYINSLPKAYSMPAYFCHHSLSKFPNNFAMDAEMQCNILRKSFEKLSMLMKSMENVSPILMGALNYDLYKWAYCSVNSRCIYMECGGKNCSGKLCTYHLSLAPFLDFLNHDVDVQIAAGYNEVDKKYEISCQSKIRKYSQVFISYGCHSNRKLLIEYGFIIHRNYHDSIPFSIEEILLSLKDCQILSSNLSRKMKFIQGKNLIKSLVCTCDGLSWNLAIVLRILSSSYDIKWWELNLHNVHKFSSDANANFEILKKRLLFLKLQEYNSKSKAFTECSGNCLNQQQLINDLLSIEKSILHKAL